MAHAPRAPRAPAAAPLGRITSAFLESRPEPPPPAPSRLRKPSPPPRAGPSAWNPHDTRPQSGDERHARPSRFDRPSRFALAEDLERKRSERLLRHTPLNDSCSPRVLPPPRKGDDRWQAIPDRPRAARSRRSPSPLSRRDTTYDKNERSNRSARSPSPRGASPPPYHRRYREDRFYRHRDHRDRSRSPERGRGDWRYDGRRSPPSYRYYDRRELEKRHVSSQASVRDARDLEQRAREREARRAGRPLSHSRDSSNARFDSPRERPTPSFSPDPKQRHREQEAAYSRKRSAPHDDMDNSRYEGRRRLSRHVRDEGESKSYDDTRVRRYESSNSHHSRINRDRSRSPRREERSSALRPTASSPHSASSTHVSPSSRPDALSRSLSQTDTTTSPYRSDPLSASTLVNDQASPPLEPSSSAPKASQPLSPPADPAQARQRHSWTRSELVDEASARLVSELKERFLLDVSARFCRTELSLALRNRNEAPRHTSAPRTAPVPAPGPSSVLDSSSTAGTSPATADLTPTMPALAEKEKDQSTQQTETDNFTPALPPPPPVTSKAGLPSFGRRLPSIPKKAQVPNTTERPAHPDAPVPRSARKEDDQILPRPKSTEKASLPKKSTKALSPEPIRRHKGPAVLSEPEDEQPLPRKKSTSSLEHDKVAETTSRSTSISRAETSQSTAKVNCHADEDSASEKPSSSAANKKPAQFKPRKSSDKPARPIVTSTGSDVEKDKSQPSAPANVETGSSAGHRRRPLPDFTDSESEGEPSKPVPDPKSAIKTEVTLTADAALLQRLEAAEDPVDLALDVILSQPEADQMVSVTGEAAPPPSTLTKGADLTSDVASAFTPEAVPKKKRGRPSKKEMEARAAAAAAIISGPNNDPAEHDGGMVWAQPPAAGRSTSPGRKPPRPSASRTGNAAADLYALGIIEDEEDLYFAKLALEQLKSPATGHSESTTDAERDQSMQEAEGALPPHPSGSTRSEGISRVPAKHKAQHVPDLQDAAPDASKSAAGVLASAREARADGRRLVANLELQKRDSTIDSELLSINQLRTRKKALRFAKSRIHDWGLYALESIGPGDMVIEYVGELVRHQVADEREKAYERSGQFSTYLFRVDDDLVVDATRKGNIARLMNHCCTPNCTAKILTVNGDKRIVLFAKQWIEPGDEITYDYKLAANANDEDAIPCLCGSEGCRHFL